MPKILVEDDGSNGTVRVERNGKIHRGEWQDDGDGEYTVQEDDGSDIWILNAALSAWTGQEEEFELSDQELSDQGGGAWEP